MNTLTKVFAILIIGVSAWCWGTEVQLHLFKNQALSVNFVNKSQSVGSCVIDNKEIGVNTCIFIIYKIKNYVTIVFLDKNEKEITESKNIKIDESLWIKTYGYLYFLMKDLLRKENPQFSNISDIELDKYLEATDEELTINSIQNFEDRVQLYNKLRNYIESMYNNLPENIEKKLTIKIDPVAYTPEISPKIVPPVQRSQQAALKPLPIKLATSLDMQNMKIDEDAKIISMEYSNKSEPIAIFNNGKEAVSISWHKVTIDKNKKTIRIELYSGDTSNNRTITNVDDIALNKIEVLSKTIFALYLDHYPKEQREEKFKILKNSGLSVQNLSVQNIIRKATLVSLYNYITTILLVSGIFSEATILKIPERANQTILHQTEAMLSMAPSKPAAVNTPRSTTEEIPTITIDPIVYIPSTYNLFHGPKALLNYFSQKATSIRQQYITPVTRKLWSSPTREKILGTLTGVGLGANAVAAYYYLYAKPGK